MPRNDSPSPAQVAAAVLAATEAGQRICTAVVVRSSNGAIVGRRRWWIVEGAASATNASASTGDGSGDGLKERDAACGAQEGSLGSPVLDEAAAQAAADLFAPRQTSGTANREFRYTTETGAEVTATVYLELHAPAAKMVVVGAGHVAAPLVRLAAMLGLRVEVLDDRPEFADPKRFPDASAVRVIDFRDPFADTSLAPADHVVLVTRGHRFDYECLVRLLRMARPPAYVGMIGSRRRVRATHEQLAREGFTPEEMRRVRAPVGLDLGGQSPAEIAVSVAAEIVMHRAGGTGAPLFEKERVVDRFFDGRKKSR